MGTGIERTDILRTKARTTPRVWRRWSVVCDAVDGACCLAGSVARAALVTFVVPAVAASACKKLAVWRMGRALTAERATAGRLDTRGRQ